jgi:hypothetical protein
MSNSTNTGRRERGGGIGEEENGSVMFFFFFGLGLIGEAKKASL